MLIEQMMRQTFYDKVDPRRRQELKDSNMIHEDHKAMSNMPTKAIHREYNQNTFGMSPLFDDEVG